MAYVLPDKKMKGNFGPATSETEHVPAKYL